MVAGGRSVEDGFDGWILKFWYGWLGLEFFFLSNACMWREA